MAASGSPGARHSPRQAHHPVLADETLDLLRIGANQQVIDTTVGLGGHAERFLEKLIPNGRLLGIDADPESVQLAKKHLERFGDRAILRRGNFSEIDAIADEDGFTNVDAILFDLGISSGQLEDARLGFSFLRSGPLDMRMDPDEVVIAEDIVNRWPEYKLADLFLRIGNERRARTIAKAIVASRPIKTTTQLAEILTQAKGGKFGKIHPATKVFLALRIAVNKELENLETALPKAVTLLKVGGRIGVISFHSGEDRIIKQFFKTNLSLEVITKKPVRPTLEEIRRNPRARSAKLRVACKR